MDEQVRKRSRRLIGWICDQVDRSPPRVYQVHLSTGQTLEGELSPFDDESEFIRLNDGGHTSAVSLAHIVFVREKSESKT